MVQMMSLCWISSMFPVHVYILSERQYSLEPENIWAVNSALLMDIIRSHHLTVCHRAYRMNGNVNIP
jgi:hypothetical protein